jgi:Immunity protein 35
MELFEKGMRVNELSRFFQSLRSALRFRVLLFSLTFLFFAASCATGGSPSMTEKSAGPITKDRALDIARRTIATLKPGTELVILEDKTVEKDFGWVFFYTTKKYLESHNSRDLLPGNSPLVVERADGSTHFLSTSLPPNRAIEEFESSWRKKKTGAN